MGKDISSIRRKSILSKLIKLTSIRITLIMELNIRSMVYQLECMVGSIRRHVLSDGNPNPRIL